MTNRALLIGSQTDGLLGTTNDVDAMSQLLEARQFTIHRRVDGDATRAAILDAYEKLIADTKDGDAAVVFYSGHGGRSKNPSAGQGFGPAYFHFIVPVDIYDTKEGDFRGITTHELSALLARLTAKTKNVTVILDCCHAAMMSRGLEVFRVKAQSRLWQLGIESHLEKLRDLGLDVSGQPAGNPHAVGVVASGPNEAAYEHSAGDTVLGVLTESLQVALSEARSSNIDWRTVGARIRERVTTRFPGQRPTIEGPVSRLLFQQVEARGRGVIPLVERDGEVLLDAGRLHGVHTGDEYAVMPPGATHVDRGARIAVATVTSVGGAASQISLSFDAEHETVSTGDLAFPVGVAFSRGAIWVDGGADAEMLRAAIRQSAFLSLASAPGDALAHAVVEDGLAELRDPLGALLWPAKPCNPAGIADTLKNLEKESQARAVRLLLGGEGAAELAAAVELSWGIVDGGVIHELAHQGETVHREERLCLRVRNRSDAKVWVSVLDVGLSAGITLLNRDFAAEGVELSKDDERVFGARDQKGNLLGSQLFWPKGLPQDRPRMESLRVIVMDRPHDLRMLQQAAMRGRLPPGSKPAAKSALRAVLDQVSTGRTRDVSLDDEAAADLRYDVHRIDFFVDPTPGMTRSASPFLIDAMPHASVLQFAPHARGSAAVRKVALCLTDLVVHANRAWGKAPIRVDTMVVTRSAVTQELTSWQKTFRYPRIGDETRLPFGKEILYLGEVEDFLTFGIWVSHDVAESKTLAELFSAELNSDRFRTAAATIIALGTAAPQAAVAVAAAGAAATLLEIGYKLLSTALPKSIGLYRNSFLGSDAFGLGRHPARDLLRAQDFSLSFVITDEGAAQVPVEAPAAQPPKGDPLKMFRAERARHSTKKLEGGEHLWLANAGLFAACSESGIDRTPFMRLKRRDGAETFSYGELVALSGDFYETPEDLFEEKPGLLPWLYEGNDLSDLKKLLRDELYWIEDDQRNEHVGYPADTIALAWNAKNFLELAKRNKDHFAWHNMIAYCRYHERALQLAVSADAEDDGDPKWRRALFFNAFADHFLTDGFAAGHVRVPRAQIREWGDRRGYDSSLSGVLSKLLHDQDGHVTSLHARGEKGLGATEGLWVQNSLGVEWYTRCDGQVFIVKPDATAPLVAEPVRAVKQSLLELFRARKERQLPVGVFRATEHVPFPHPLLPPLTSKFTATAPDARIADLVGGMKWYFKIPGTSANLQPKHVKKLLQDLPSMMQLMRAAVAKDVAEAPHVSRRLAQPYIEAYKRLA